MKVIVEVTLRICKLQRQGLPTDALCRHSLRGFREQDSVRSQYCQHAPQMGAWHPCARHTDRILILLLSVSKETLGSVSIKPTRTVFRMHSNILYIRTASVV
jgi:hypothetical protein